MVPRDHRWLTLWERGTVIGKFIARRAICLDASRPVFLGRLGGQERYPCDPVPQLPPPRPRLLRRPEALHALGDAGRGGPLERVVPPRRQWHQPRARG